MLSTMTQEKQTASYQSYTVRSTTLHIVPLHQPEPMPTWHTRALHARCCVHGVTEDAELGQLAPDQSSHLSAVQKGRQSERGPLWRAPWTRQAQQLQGWHANTTKFLFIFGICVVPVGCWGRQLGATPCISTMHSSPARSHSRKVRCGCRCGSPPAARCVACTPAHTAPVEK